MKIILLLLASLSLCACESTNPNDGAVVRQAVANEASYIPAQSADPTSAASPAIQVVNGLNDTRGKFWNTSGTPTQTHIDAR